MLVVGPRGGATGGVAMFNDILLASPLAERFELIHLDTTRTPAGRGKAATLAPINLLYFARQALRLVSILSTHRPRIIHQPITYGISFWKECAFLALASLFGAATVGHLHGGAFLEFLHAASGRKRRRIAAALRPLSAMIALSEGWRRALLEEVDSGLRVVVIPNTVEAGFARWADRFDRSVRRERVTVLCLGRLSSRKGTIDALRAAPLLRERVVQARLVFAGEAATAADREEIDRALETVGRDGVEFTGAVSGEAKRRLFEEADIFLLPSHVENLPIVVLEAMAAGLPLVVTKVGALPEFLAEGQNALFVRAGDPEEIASKVAELAARPDSRRSMGEANRRLFREEFGPERMFARIEKLYLDLLGSAGQEAGGVATAPGGKQ